MNTKRLVLLIGLVALTGVILIVISALSIIDANIASPSVTPTPEYKVEHSAEGEGKKGENNTIDLAVLSLQQCQKGVLVASTTIPIDPGEYKEFTIGQYQIGLYNWGNTFGVPRDYTPPGWDINPPEATIPWKGRYSGSEFRTFRFKERDSLNWLAWDLPVNDRIVTIKAQENNTIVIEETCNKSAP